MYNGVWFQRNNGKQAVIQLVNNRFRYQVYDLWLSRFNTLVPGELLAMGSENTLEGAKAKAFVVLNNPQAGGIR